MESKQKAIHSHPTQLPMAEALDLWRANLSTKHQRIVLFLYSLHFLVQVCRRPKLQKKKKIKHGMEKERIIPFNDCNFEQRVLSRNQANISSSSISVRLVFPAAGQSWGQRSEVCGCPSRCTAWLSVVLFFLNFSFSAFVFALSGCELEF